MLAWSTIGGSFVMEDFVKKPEKVEA